MKDILSFLLLSTLLIAVRLGPTEARGGFRPAASQGGGMGIGGASGGITGGQGSSNGGMTPGAAANPQSQRDADWRAEDLRNRQMEQDAVARRQQREEAARERNDGYSGSPVPLAPSETIGVQAVAVPVYQYTLGGGDDPQDPLNPANYGDGYHTHGGYYAGGYRGAPIGSLGGNREDVSHLGSFPR